MTHYNCICIILVLIIWRWPRVADTCQWLLCNKKLHL